MQGATEGQSSQTVSALLKLREFILNGEVKAGERMSELALVERLGVSRTPIRSALARLEQEGLLRALPTGGFAVNAFNERDIHAAIEIRGTLEGLAARLAAERGVSAAELVDLKQCVSELDELVFERGVTVDNFSSYAKLNEQFHAIIIDLADSAVLSRQIARAIALPFASAGAFVMVQASLPGGTDDVHGRAGSASLHRARDRGAGRRARGNADARARAARAAKSRTCVARPPDAQARAGLKSHHLQDA